MSHHHEHDHTHPRRHPQTGMKPHVKWGLLIAVILMLGAIAIYVLTNDESVQPRQTPPAQPAPTAPTAPTTP